MSQERRVHRILDANFNRALEGLRVAEEVVRFAFDSAAAQKELKRCRHLLSGVLKNFPVSATRMMASRKTSSDVGRQSRVGQLKRLDLVDVFAANIQRAKEAVRCLEEFSKLIDEGVSKDVEQIRFRIYAIEKKYLSKLEALRDHLSGAAGNATARGSRRRGHSRGRRRHTVKR